MPRLGTHRCPAVGDPVRARSDRPALGVQADLVRLVEAKTNSFANLGAAENQAVAQHASVISNSWGGSDASDATYGAYFNDPGTAITVSSGDGGYGVEYPASSHYVTAVGGTSLTSGGGSRGWSQTAWSGAGSGCSTLNAALSGAASFNTGCTMRAMADVSAVADPSTGVAGNEASIDNYPYTHSSNFDVTSGGHGTCPTGLGTPNGTGGF